MNTHQLTIKYNLVDKKHLTKLDNCFYRTVRNSRLDCYKKLQWFLTESEASDAGHLEITSVQVEKL